jgi:hypothetical protein
MSAAGIAFEKMLLAAMQWRAWTIELDEFAPTVAGIAAAAEQQQQHAVRGPQKVFQTQPCCYILVLILLFCCICTCSTSATCTPPVSAARLHAIINYKQLSDAAAVCKPWTLRS